LHGGGGGRIVMLNEQQKHQRGKTNSGDGSNDDFADAFHFRFSGLGSLNLVA
jgi:hypothetical protein